MSKDRFTEVLFEAISDIDDELITEADEYVRDDKVIPFSKKNNRYIMIAACLAFIVVVSIPIISLMNGEFGPFATKDQAIEETADEAFNMMSDDAEAAYIADSITDKAEGVKGENTTVYNQIASVTEEWNGQTIHTNFYNGHILDNPANDPGEVLTLMEVTKIGEKTYYIVVVRHERVKVYDAATLEPLVDNEGDSVDAVALELGIAG